MQTHCSHHNLHSSLALPSTTLRTRCLFTISFALDCASTLPQHWWATRCTMACLILFPNSCQTGDTNSSVLPCPQCTAFTKKWYNMIPLAYLFCFWSNGLGLGRPTSTGWPNLNHWQIWKHKFGLPTILLSRHYGNSEINFSACISQLAWY